MITKEFIQMYTIEYKTYLITVHKGGWCSTYFDNFRTLLAAKQGVTKYAKQFSKGV